MSDFLTQLIMLVEKEITKGVKAGDILDPLVENLARVIVGTARSAPEHQRKATLESLVEIIRNDLDGAVVRHDKLLPR
jgi:hypothetical protein